MRLKKLLIKGSYLSEIANFARCVVFNAIRSVEFATPPPRNTFETPDSARWFNNLCCTLGRICNPAFKSDFLDSLLWRSLPSWGSYWSRITNSAQRSGMLILIIFHSLILPSCDRDKNHPGYDYFPDMAYANSYETYAPNPNFKDRKTLQEPVPGTYARNAEYYPYEKTDEGILKAAKLKNPFSPNLENIERGKVVYQNICLHCHGAKADGKGHLFTSGKYPFPPASLIVPKTINRTDGEIFHIITVGIGIMGPHQIIVRPNDRWKTVLYLRLLQDSIK